MTRAVILAVFAAVALLTTAMEAQWFNFPAPGIPRTADGKPDLDAPAPRTAAGTPDLSGTWYVYAGLAYAGNLVADVASDDIMPWAAALSHERMLELGTGDSSTVGCLPRGPRYLTGGVVRQLTRIIQTPTLVTMLFEDLAYRQIYLDGRPLPKDPNPSFMGYSVGGMAMFSSSTQSASTIARGWISVGILTRMLFTQQSGIEE
jgi:hypothetical protein